MNLISYLQHNTPLGREEKEYKSRYCVIVRLYFSRWRPELEECGGFAEKIIGLQGEETRLTLKYSPNGMLVREDARWFKQLAA